MLDCQTKISFLLTGFELDYWNIKTSNANFTSGSPKELITGLDLGYRKTEPNIVTFKCSGSRLKFI